MRLPCPYCGERDIREFSCKGDAAYLDRPGPQDGEEAWHAYLHLRANPAGRARELWHHGAGCGAWLVVERDTATHDVFGARPAAEEKAGR